MINIFISSTFSDMHAERDAIQMNILPALRKRAEQLGEGFDFCDLRWGINTQDIDEDKRMGKILEVCFKEINKCKPFMIVLLGERYGSSPSKDRLDEVLTYMNMPENNRSFDKQDVEGKSYTNLEIQFGPLADDEQFRRTLFFFRRHIEGAPEKFCASDEDTEKMSELKRAIKKRSEKLGVQNIVEYSLLWDRGTDALSGIEEFTSLMSQKLSSLLEPVFSELEKLSPAEKSLRKNELFVSEKAKVLAGMDDVLTKCENILSGNRQLIIHGPSGCGKSCLLAKIAADKIAEGNNVFPYVCSNENKPRIADIYADVISYLRKFVGEPASISYSLSEDSDCYMNSVSERENLICEEIDRLLYLYDSSEMSPLYIFIDAVENINRENSRWYDIEFFKNIYSKIYFVYSYACDSDYSSGVNKTYVFINSDNADISSVINSCMRTRGKYLPNEITEKIVEGFSGNTPYYITLLFKRLSLLNAEDFAEGTGNVSQLKIYRRIIDSAPKSEEEFCRDLISVLANRTNSSFVNACVSYIVASAQCGIRKNDLQKLIADDGGEWANDYFSVVMNTLDVIFTELYDGRIIISDAKLRNLLARDFDITRLQKNILSHVKALPKDDVYRVSYIFDYCVFADDKQTFIDVLQKDYNYNERFALSFNNTLKVDWFIRLLSCAEQYGADKRTVNFINEPLYRARTLYEGQYREVFAKVVAFCERNKNIPKNCYAVAQGILAHYAPGSEFDAVAESKKALALYKGLSRSDADWVSIELANVYLNYIYALIVRYHFDEAQLVLDEFYAFLESKKDSFIKARLAYLLYEFSSLYEKLFYERKEKHYFDDDYDDFQEQLNYAEKFTANVYSRCLEYVSGETNLSSLLGSFIFKLLDKLSNNVLSDHIGSSAIEKNIKVHLPILEEFAENFKEDAFDSALTKYYRNCAKFFLINGRVQTALEYSEKAVGLAESNVANNDNSPYRLIKMCLLHFNNANVLLKADKYEEANISFDRAGEKLFTYLNRHMPETMCNGYFVDDGRVRFGDGLEPFDIFLTYAGIRLGKIQSLLNLGRIDECLSETYTFVNYFYIYIFNEIEVPSVFESLNLWAEMLKVLRHLIDKDLVAGDGLIELIDAVYSVSEHIDACAHFAEISVRYIADSVIASAIESCKRQKNSEAAVIIRDKFKTRSDEEIAQDAYLDIINSLSDQILYEQNDNGAGDGEGGISDEQLNNLPKSVFKYVKKCIHRISSKNNEIKEKFAAAGLLQAYLSVLNINSGLARKLSRQILNITQKDIKKINNSYVSRCFIRLHFKLDVVYKGTISAIDTICKTNGSSDNEYDEYAYNYAALAACYELSRKYSQAVQNYETALEYCKKWIEIDGDGGAPSWFYATCLNCFGQLLERRYDKRAFSYYSEAIEVLNEAFEIKEAMNEYKQVELCIFDIYLSAMFNKAFCTFPDSSYSETDRKRDLLEIEKYAKYLFEKSGIKYYEKITKVLGD